MGDLFFMESIIIYWYARSSDVYGFVFASALTPDWPFSNLEALKCVHRQILCTSEMPIDGS